LHILQKIEQHTATTNENFFGKETHLNRIIQYKFNANQVPLEFEKHNSIETLIYPAFSG